MSAIVKEVSNDKVRVCLLDDGSVSLIIPCPDKLSNERFMTLTARLEKILDQLGASVKLL